MLNSSGEPPSEPEPRDLEEALEVIAQLRASVESRTVIGQATGIVMDIYGIDADHAFSVLTRVSQNTNRKVRDLAAEVVSSRKLEGGPDTA